MIRKEKNGIEWLEFELLANIPNLKHAVFLRGHDFDLTNSDNQNRVKETLELPNLITANQCHSDRVIAVTPETQPTECDALATNQANIGMMIKHADCQAAIFYDPVHHALANVHSGWRGSVQNIYANTIAFMHKHYGTKPEDLLVAISPSLGPENAEFNKYKEELPESFWSFQPTPNHFDFWAISRMQLTQCGVLPEHIQIAEMDTYSDTENCFSFRRNHTTARHGTVAALLTK